MKLLLYLNINNTKTFYNNYYTLVYKIICLLLINIDLLSDFYLYTANDIQNLM